MDDVDLLDVYNAASLMLTSPSSGTAQYGHGGFRDNGWSYWHYSTLPIMFYDADQAPTAEDTKRYSLVRVLALTASVQCGGSTTEP